MPKREIFDCSDFPGFYTIKSSWVGDLMVKILTYYIIFEGAKPHLVSDAHAENTRKELMRMLIMLISSLRVCLAWFVGISITNGPLKNGKLMRMLSIRTSALRACSACAPVPDAYAQHTHKGRSIHIRK